MVLKYGMKRDFNAWLATLGDAAPVKSLTDLRYFNLANAHSHAIRYGQLKLEISDEMDLVVDKARYRADRKKDIELTATHGIDKVMRKHRLDALFFPGRSGARLAARPGYPTVIVPFGQVANTPTPPFPENFEARPAPFGVSFAGTSCSEPRLIELAYAFEQATRRRIPPPMAQSQGSSRQGGDRPSSVSQEAEGRIEDRFVGLWKFVAREQRRGDGELVPMEGPSRTGFIIYTATGHMAVQLMLDNRQAYPIDQPTGEQAQDALASYIAYYGTFTVDPAEGTVTHHRQGHLNPAQMTDAVRSYTFSGNRLMLTMPAGAIAGEETTTIVWERVE